MNMQALMRQAQNLQKDMLNAKQEIDSMIFSGENGFVKVKVNGKKEVIEIKIENEEIEKDDLEVLSDMLIIALNNAFKEVDKKTEEKMGKFSNISGLF